MVAIEFDDVSKQFGPIQAINRVSFSIPQGEFVTVIGNSGCGKTTLLKMVNALIVPDKGTVLVNEQDIKKQNPLELRRNIGYAIQGSVLFPHLSVQDNIAYVPRLLNRTNPAKTQEAVTKWMNLVNLDASLKTRYPLELSGGQAQRVGIARALAASPRILLADEPFSAVDAITRTTLQDEIKRIHAQTEITILFVTHDIEEAFYLGTRVIVLENGHLVQYAKPADVINHPASEFVQLLTSRKGRQITTAL